MPEWITIPTFASGDVVRAEKFQDIWTDIYHLKDPLFALQPTIGDASTVSTFTSTVAWANVDATNYQLNFKSFGNDILLVAFVRAFHSASGGVGYFRFLLDNIAYGNTNGVGGFNLTGVQTLAEVHCFTYVWEGVSVGSHTASLQVMNGVAGTLSIYMYPNLRMWAMEF